VEGGSREKFGGTGLPLAIPSIRDYDGNSRDQTQSETNNKKETDVGSEYDVIREIGSNPGSGVTTTKTKVTSK